MNIITLTTDFGSSNYSVASLKGSILSCAEESHIVDITHDIGNFDIVEAAFVLENTYKSFPENTINIVSVNCYYAPKMRFLILKQKGYYFISPDNGILSLISHDFSDDELIYVEYGNTSKGMFEIIGEVAGKIISGAEFSEIGIPVDNISKKISFQPVISNNTIRATVLFIDKFGNAVVNVKKELFETSRKGRPFSLYYSPKDTLTRIDKKYSDVSYGDEVCFFNSAGYLEIAVYMGNASEIIGLTKDSPIQIVFEE